MADVKAGACFAEVHGSEDIARRDEVELHAVAPPARPPATIDGDLPRAIATWKRDDKDLRASSGRQGERHELSVRRELPTRLQALGGRGSQKRPGGFAGSEGMQPDL